MEVAYLSSLLFFVQIIDNQYSIKLWADVNYHIPTGFGFSPKASGFYPFGDANDLVRGRR